MLLVRGDGGREWLAERLADAGAGVHAVAAYTRRAPRFDGGAEEDGEVKDAAEAALFRLLIVITESARASRYMLFSGSASVSTTTGSLSVTTGFLTVSNILSNIVFLVMDQILRG